MTIPEITDKAPLELPLPSSNKEIQQHVLNTSQHLVILSLLYDGADTSPEAQEKIARFMHSTHQELKKLLLDLPEEVRIQYLEALENKAARVPRKTKKKQP